jgi:glycosyltransferase involved in cell wall biosynthesis
MKNIEETLSFPTKNTLVVIFTYRSPFGSIPEFVDEEIPYWKDAKKLLVISLADKNERHEAIDGNAEAYAVYPVSNPLKRFIAVFNGLWNSGFLKEIIKIITTPKNILQKCLQLALHAQAMGRYYQGARRVLEQQQISEFDTVILYSYLLDPSTHAAIKIKKDLKTNRTIVITRAHGSDLYEYANDVNYLPFRKQLLIACNGIFPISKHGMSYMMGHWQCPFEKIEVARLGITDHFLGRYPKRDKCFHIFSCAYITPLKRVHLVAEALSKIENVNIRWTHIGGGPELEKLKEICANLLKTKRNIEYDLRGDLLHKDVINILKEENINLLVNTSISEGIPVSMMEVQCSGIPVLAPCIGGIGEFVEHDVNGRLMPSNFSVEELRREILSISQMDDTKYEQMCLNSRKMWCKFYSAQNNYSKFVQSVFRLSTSTY